MWALTCLRRTRNRRALGGRYAGDVRVRLLVSAVLLRAMPRALHETADLEQAKYAARQVP